MNGEIFYTLTEAKVLIERWRVHYNTARPHSSLGYRPPAPEAWTQLEASEDEWSGGGSVAPPWAGSAPLGSLAPLRPPTASVAKADGLT